MVPQRIVSGTSLCCFHTLALTAGVGLFAALPAAAGDSPSFGELPDAFTGDVLPILNEFCVDCHSGDSPEGNLDLERFSSFERVRSHPAAWVKAEEFLRLGEMPPDDNPQPSADQMRRLRGWIDRYLDAEARANAGDPGPVVLRRLNNSEYTYTIRDLTGVNLDPAHDFPVDGAAGEGFTNTGSALVMSPALVEKHFNAAREIAAHAVLVPDGVEFSEGTTTRDWSNERVAEIRAIYRQYTSGNQDVSALDHWSVSNFLSATDEDGRLNLTPYVTAFVRHPELWIGGPDVVESVAAQEHVNLKYLRQLVAGLAKGDSLLTSRLREHLQSAAPDDVPRIVADISRWQDQLWSFNAVGHYGMIRPWQVPATPVSATREFRVRIERLSAGGDPTFYLVASAPGPVDRVEWRGARIERPGKPAVWLKDVRGGTAVLERLREQALHNTADYLAAAFAARAAGGEDVATLATEHHVDPLILRAWLAFLGVSTEGEVALGEPLDNRIESVGGYSFVQGWGLPGVDALSVVGNSSDEQAKIPGDMNPHRVAVHPRPERFVAAGWKSLIEGDVRIEAAVHHAHPACGNGVSWSVDLRRGAQKRALRSGNVDLGGTAGIEPVEALHVRPGDVVSLVIGPRDGSHVCDLTEIDLAIHETGGDGRSWSLAGDCADTIAAGNPHADRLGNEGVWHFYTEMIDGSENRPVISEGSILAAWLETADPEQAKHLAEQLAGVLVAEPTSETTPADRELREQLVSLGGPLFGRLDFAKLASQAQPDELAAAKYGVDPPLATDASGTFVAEAPSVISVPLPAELFEGAELVASAGLSASASPDAIVQFDVVPAAPADAHGLQPGVPFVVAAGSPAEARLQQSLDGFRALFPAAMCYARIVPVDEVVTLVIYHREDDQLERLMLSDAEKQRLDRLWDELHYVSRDALRMETGLEQILEFATQDSDPALFDPVREPIAKAAEAFRQRLLETQPAHVDAVLKFAERAWRRPITPEEAGRIRKLYGDLTGENIPHEDAVRLMLARVLTAPAFLYRLEEPGPGAEPSPVSDWEMASRLSYFLWSTLPDADLRAAAAAGRLSDPETLRSQARRMLVDDRIRHLAVEFGCQWLHIRDFDMNAEKNERQFPEFADLRDDMYEESVRFFTDFFRNDRSVLSILDSDRTFLNESLAALYGIPGVEGDEWREVDGVGQFHRGGILTQATLLASQSGASRTSPVLRGNWVSETLLGERLPRPPKGVPVLPETVPEGLTERQLIEQHSTAPECARCHTRIDPYGFALENYDAIGRYREQSTSGDPIDVRTTLIDGTELTGLSGLQDYLLTTRRNEFLRQFCRKLLGYALGRSVQLSDQPLLDEMIQRLAANEYRVSVAIDAIVTSPQFRMIRGAERETPSVE